MKRKKAL